MDNVFFGKTIEKVRKNRDIKLVITERKRNYLVSEPNYHATMFLKQNLLTMEMKKTITLMNIPFCLGLSILQLSQILMYEIWYSYVRPKYGKKTKLCYMKTVSLYT